jgi:hypothetical protein
VADRWRAKGWPVHPLYTAPTAALEKGDGRDAWISVDAEKPRAEWDKYYEDDFSEPVAVMIDYNGHHRRSEMTWRYSFAHGGWVIANLADGYMPSDYVEYGTVTHWAPLPAALSQKANHLAQEADRG